MCYKTKKIKRQINWGHDPGLHEDEISWHNRKVLGKFSHDKAVTELLVYADSFHCVVGHMKR